MALGSAFVDFTLVLCRCDLVVSISAVLRWCLASNPIGVVGIGIRFRSARFIKPPWLGLDSLVSWRFCPNPNDSSVGYIIGKFDRFSFDRHPAMGDW
jgi:hypothetical protein